MSFRLLKLVFIVYRYLAITPVSITVKKITVFQKLHSILVIILMNLGIAVSLNNRHFYSGFIPIKAIVCMLIDAGLFIFHTYIVLAPSFVKTRQWEILLKNLKTPILKPCISCKEKHTFPYYLGFVFIQLYYLFVVIYTSYVWSFVTIFNYLEGYGIVLVQFYHVYLYNFLLCLIMNILLSSYKHMNIFLGQNLQQLKIEKPVTKNFANLLNRTEFMLQILKKSVDIFNDLFGWPIALIVVLAGLQLLNYLHYLFINSSKYDPSLQWMLVTADLMNLSANMV
jgi:hypothetical protein